MRGSPDENSDLHALQSAHAKHAFATSSAGNRRDGAGGEPPRAEGESMTDFIVISGRDVSVRRAADEPWRRRTLVMSTVVLAVATILLAGMVAVSTSTGGRTRVQLGAFASDSLFTLLVLCALSALATGLWLVPVSRPALFVLVPARAVACCATFFAAMALWLISETTVTPVLENGCPTGYVVTEDVRLFAVTGTLQRQDGIFATDVATMRGDHAFTPFAAGEYVVDDEGEILHIRYAQNANSAGAVILPGEPALVAPRLVRHAQPCAD